MLAFQPLLRICGQSCSQFTYNNFNSPAHSSTCSIKQWSFNTTSIKSFSVTCQWQDSLLPLPPSSARLATLFSSFPRTLGDVHLLGLSADAQTAYLTLQFHNSPGTRPSYAISSYALPLPLQSPSDRLFLRESFAYLNPSAIIPLTPLPKGAEAVRIILPYEVRQFLEIDPNYMAASLPWRGLNGRLDTALRALKQAGGAIVACSLNEVPTADGITLTAKVYIRKHGGVPQEISVAPVWAIGIAAGAQVGCFFPRDTFDKCSVRVLDMESVFASAGHQPVIEDNKDNISLQTDDTNSKIKKSNTVELENARFDAWELSADEVLSLNEQGLYRLLKRHEATPDAEGWSGALRALLPYLDEVVRREIGMRLAAENGDLKLAAELERGRSTRGKLLAELRENEKNGQLSEVLRIAQRIRIIEEGIADITAEPGSYDSDLDRDEWYRPNR